MLKVGITGNIGSGKTTVCKIFEQLNIPVYYADDRAKYLMANDATLIYEIKSLFGEAAYSAEGVLNRKLIANAVFTQPLLLKKLNAVVHPAVARDTNIWFNEQKSDYALKEAALLVETGAYKIMDKLIVVTAPNAIRKKRVMYRDNVTETDFINRDKNQMPAKEKCKLADFIIKNDEKSLLIPQVIQIHKKIMDMLHAN